MRSEPTTVFLQTLKFAQDVLEIKNLQRNFPIMIPSPVPPQLQGLSQVEKMLITRAVSIMRVYIKPGAQRGFSGHWINLCQNMKELASSLPRYSKDLCVKGRNLTFKDDSVRRQKVHNVLINKHWIRYQAMVYHQICWFLKQMMRLSQTLLSWILAHPLMITLVRIQYTINLMIWVVFYLLVNNRSENSMLLESSFLQMNHCYGLLLKSHWMIIRQSL